MLSATLWFQKRLQQWKSNNGSGWCKLPGLEREKTKKEKEWQIIKKDTQKVETEWPLLGQTNKPSSQTIIYTVGHSFIFNDQLKSLLSLTLYNYLLSFNIYHQLMIMLTTFWQEGTTLLDKSWNFHFTLRLKSIHWIYLWTNT